MVTCSFGYKTGAMYPIDSDIQDKRAGVETSEIVNNRVAAHMLNRRTGEVCHLAHEEHMR